MPTSAYQLTPLVDGHATIPYAEVLGRDEPAEWNCPMQPLDNYGRLRLSCGGYLIQTGNRVVLVDAGVGNPSRGLWSGGGLPRALRTAGFEPSDVTDVAFTHLHFDHVGWATQEGAPFFPHATYRVHEDDWAHFVTAEHALPGAVRKLSPLAERLVTFDREWTLAPGIDAIPAPGHTPGTTVFRVSLGRDSVLLLGDVAHSVAELTDPSWFGRHDDDPPAARAIRDALVKDAMRSGTLIAAAHFPDLAYGRLESQSGSRTFTFI